MIKLEEQLQKELDRYKGINKYVTNLLTEQGAPPMDDPAAAGVPPPPGGDMGSLPPTGGNMGAMPPATGATATAGAEPTGDAAKGELPEPGTDDTTEEIDITDLVSMTKSIKKELEIRKTDNTGTDQKMGEVFNKLNDLEQKLGEMDNIINKIDQMSSKIEEIRPKTPVEKLEMRSLDSDPFRQKPDEFFAQKQIDMKQTGKEYLLTKSDVENYSKDMMKQSFNPNQQEFNSVQF